MKKVICFLALGLVSTAFANPTLPKKDIQTLQGNAQVKELGCSSFESVNIKSLSGRAIEVQEDKYGGKNLINDAKVVCKVFDNYIDENKAIVYKSEIGKIKGVDVEIPHSVFASTVGGGRDKDGWNVYCKRDDIDDTLVCYTINGHLFVFSSDSGYDPIIGVEKASGTASYLRIDKNKAFSTKNDGRFTAEESRQIVEQMKSGDSALVRFTKAGEGSSTDEKLKLTQFPAAIEVLDLMRAAYK